MSAYTTEYYHPDRNVGTTFKTGRILHSQHSQYQDIDVYETPAFGKMLLLDGQVQFTDRDEFIYHEMMTHPALYAVQVENKRVLVIGGGDGGCVREILKHSSVESIRLVEIDREVSETIKKFWPDMYTALMHPITWLDYQDGFEMVKKMTNLNKDELMLTELFGTIEYDVIIVDSTSPGTIADPLFTESFYSGLYKLLSADGIAIMQTESPYYDPHVLRDTVSYLHKAGFPTVKPYLSYIPSYPGGMWSMTMAVKNDMCKPFTWPTMPGLKYFSPEIFQAALVLPSFIGESNESP